MPLPPARTERLAALRAEVRAIERTGARAKAAALPFGIAAIDDRLADGGIAHAALHEACGAGGGLAHHAAATVFLASIAARLDGPVLWVLRRRDLFAPALQNAGLAADRLIYAEAGVEADVLAVMEDALRHGALGAVIGEVARAGLTVTRRLQLAAEEGGTTALLLRTPRRGDEDPLAEPSSAVTRWRIGCAPSAPLSVPGVGRARWRLALVRQRGGERGIGWWRQMMMRVASLYLPDLAIERIRRADARGRGLPVAIPATPPDRAATPRDPRVAADGQVRAAPAGARSATAQDARAAPPHIASSAAPHIACSCPREGGGWRPGAHWAQAAAPDAKDMCAIHAPAKRQGVAQADADGPVPAQVAGTPASSRCDPSGAPEHADPSGASGVRAAAVNPNGPALRSHADDDGLAAAAVSGTAWRSDCAPPHGASGGRAVIGHPPPPQEDRADEASRAPAAVAMLPSSRSGPRGAGTPAAVAPPARTHPHAAIRTDADPMQRWLARDQARRVALAAEIATLPAHRRPSPRELGRSAHGGAIPFRAMRSDEAGGLRAPDVDRFAAGSGQPGSSARPPLDPAKAPRGYAPEWAFWHTSRGLGGTVGRAVAGADTPPRAQPPTVRPSAAPLVTALRTGARIVVGAACADARAAGIAPGMAITLARAMLPALDVRDADPAGDAAAIAKLAAHAARRWSPIAALDDSGGYADGVWLDMSAAPLFGGERALCRRILRWLARRGYRGRIAIAGTPGAAHALARHGPADRALLRCRPGCEADALGPLPPAALRIAPDAAATLARLGVGTVAALAAMPRAPLARRFGTGLVQRLDAALGLAPEPLAAIVPADVAQAEARLAEPIATAEPIAQVIDDLCAALAATLRERGLGARGVALLCRRVDGSDVGVTVGTARATRDPRHLARLLRARIEMLDPGFGIETMRLIAFRAEPLAPEAYRAAADAHAPRADLAELVDLIAGRIGTRRLYRLAPIESDVPERSLAAAAPLGAALGRHPRWPRPIRLLDPPERLDHVMSELPDGPPRRFEWRGRRYALTQGDGPERIYGEWWTRGAERHAVRDYFRVEADDGQRFWLYRRGDGIDPRTGDLSWHLQGLFG